MTPTLESTIVLWALERIDARLPTKVQKMYGHQMTGSKCLMSLQPTIFQNVPLMLQELDQGAAAHGVTVDGDPVLGAGWTGSTFRRGGGSNSGGRGRGRGSSGYSGDRKFRDNKFRKPSDKFCRICYHAGSSHYQTHTISDCKLLTSADKTNLRAVLGAGTMADQEGLDEIKLEPYEAPGWDVGGGTDGEEGDGHSQETL